SMIEHIFFFSSRRRHTRSDRDWSSEVCSSDLATDRRVVASGGNRVTESAQTPAAPDERPIVSLRDVRRDYALGAERVHALQGVRSEERRVGKEGGARGGVGGVRNGGM